MSKPKLEDLEAQLRCGQSVDLDLLHELQLAHLKRSRAAASEPVCFAEFPRILFPAFLRERGFKDLSYHHDECPRAVRRVQIDNVEYRLTVWVCEQPYWEHHVGEKPREDRRYTVELYNASDDNHVRTLCQTDSIDECAGVVDELIERS